MKNFLLLLLSFILFGCSKKNLLVYETTSINCKSHYGSFVYESDTIKITYNFWENGGMLNFTIFNKLDKPFYINWGSSSFIYNGTKINCWADQAVTVSSGNYSNYYYSDRHDGYSNVVSNTYKAEKLTFIPPKSSYSRSQFNLLPIGPEALSLTALKITNSLNSQYFYQYNYSLATSNIKFRNYIAICFSENSSSFRYIDNEFYVSSIKELSEKQFRGEKSGQYGYKLPYKAKTSFYAFISQKKTINFRKKQHTY